MDYVYIFTGANATFPAATFSSFSAAHQWIQQNQLTGVLNKMPLDISVYDWAIERDFFEPKNDHQKTPRFIQSFSCAAIEHWHYEKGVF